MALYWCGNVRIDCASTGQGFLGYNMFAYCGNNPVLLVDHDGDFGVITSLVLGATMGFVTQYVSGVIENAMKDGLQTADFYIENTGTFGEYFTAVITGAVGTISIANKVGSAVVSLACDVGGPALQQVIDIASGNQSAWNNTKFLDDARSNLASDALATFSMSQVNEPRFIRDIKSEAVSQGIKGTNALNAYLKHAQNIYFGSEQFVGFSISVFSTMADQAINNMSAIFS